MHRVSILVAIVLVVLAATAQAITIDLVPVGNPGNPADTRYNGISVGAVATTYAIGKYDVTAGQYCEFLNAVAATDTYHLYKGHMDYDADPSFLGCNIKRSGTSGTYRYSVASDWANRPVNYVSWGDAARFANWMNNGQPGVVSPVPENLSSTEDGAYYLNGATTNAQLTAVTRKAGATWWIPSEDEWYKAAYFDPNKPGGAGYWDYPTKSSTSNPPSNAFSATGTNNANFYGSTFTIGWPYYRTEVGAFASSPGPYGTFDQGGNVYQWEDSNVSGHRGMRGGSFNIGLGGLAASVRGYNDAGYNEFYYGFRVASVPEPAGIIMLLGFAGLALLHYTRSGV